MLQFRKIHDNTFLYRLCPAFWAHPFFVHLEFVVRHHFFEVGIDVLLIANAIVLIVEEWEILAGTTSDLRSSETQQWARPVEITFAVIFSLEMSAKLAALGWHEYVAKPANCFDGSVTIMSVVVAIYALITDSSGQDNEGIIRYVLALRLGRFGRLLNKLKEVNRVVETFLRMLPAAAKLLKVLFVTMFLFSAAGMQLFGGLINYGPQYAQLAGAWPSSINDNYFANNFNDLASGMVVCFELLVVNNWFVLSAGFSAVAPMPFVRIFFVSVYVFGVLVCLNIVIAFAIDAYNTVYELEMKTKDEEEYLAGGSLPFKWPCKWRRVGYIQPTVGTEMHNDKLAEAINDKTSACAFDKEEWEEFEVAGLRPDHFIKSGDAYFELEAQRVSTVDARDGASEGGLGRQASPSLDQAQKRYKLVVPISLQKSASLKQTVREITRPATRPAVRELSGQELA